MSETFRFWNYRIMTAQKHWLLEFIWLLQEKEMIAIPSLYRGWVSWNIILMWAKDVTTLEVLVHLDDYFGRLCFCWLSSFLLVKSIVSRFLYIWSNPRHIFFSFSGRWLSRFWRFQNSSMWIPFLTSPAFHRELSRRRKDYSWKIRHVNLCNIFPIENGDLPVSC